MRRLFLFLVAVFMLVLAGCDSWPDNSFYSEPPPPSKNAFDEESYSNTFEFSSDGKMTHTYESSYDAPKSKVYKDGQEVFEVPSEK